MLEKNARNHQHSGGLADQNSWFAALWHGTNNCPKGSWLPNTHIEPLPTIFGFCRFLIVSRKVIFYLSFLFQVCGCWCWWEEKIVLKLLSWCESSITKRVWMAKVLPCVKISTMPSAPYWRIGAIWCAAPSLGNAGKLCRRETFVNI